MINYFKTYFGIALSLARFFALAVLLMAFGKGLQLVWLFLFAKA